MQFSLLRICHLNSSSKLKIFLILLFLEWKKVTSWFDIIFPFYHIFIPQKRILVNERRVNESRTFCCRVIIIIMKGVWWTFLWLFVCVMALGIDRRVCSKFEASELSLKKCLVDQVWCLAATVIISNQTRYQASMTLDRDTIFQSFWG